MFLLSVSVIALSLIGSITCGGKEYCVSHPDLYYANVNGLIQGGYNNMASADSTPCTKDRYKQRYREIDGRCNHPKDYGSTLMPLKRYLKPHYQDAQGINTPRIYSVEGNYYLPSPRAVSMYLFPDIMNEGDLSMFTMQFGQFLSHDIGVSPVPTGTNGTIKCCGVPAKDMHKDCFPIPIPKEDTRFENCMEFVRSEPAKDEKGNQIYPREQLNALTSFLDGSGIYGSNKETTQKLRTENGKGALLNTMWIDGKERLPNDTSARPGCLRSTKPTSYCQLSGDSRVNQQPVLSTQHLSFHLLHNYIVRELAAGILKRKGLQYTPQTVDDYIKNSSEKVKEFMFQEAKKINGAIFQKIAICDYLPFIVGPEMIEKYKLGCNKRSRYNPYVDPRLANGFIASAYRFGHTLIPNSYPVKGEPEFFKDEFFMPDSSIESHEEIIAGMLNATKEVHFDRFFAKGITEHLFETRTGAKKALDLASVNIQRGRDHGLPAYYFWRKRYGLSEMKSFDDYGTDCADKLKTLYRSYYDVDLYPGGICEPSVPGGAVGETFANIIANQCADLKYGDLYFFTHRQPVNGFTDSQVAAILDYSANALLCFSGKLSYIQANTWLKVSETNPMVECSQFKQINLEPWIDEYYELGYIQ